MKRLHLALVLLLAYNTSLTAQTSPPTPPAQTGAGTEKQEAFGRDTVLLAELVTSVEAGKAKPGDAITARLRGDIWGPTKKLLPTGTTLIGHVVEARARSKENPEWKLAVSFDKAVLKDGSEMPLNLIINNIEVPWTPPVALPKDDGLSSLNNSMARAAGPVTSSSAGSGPPPPNGTYPQRVETRPTIQEPLWAKRTTPNSPSSPGSSPSGLPGVELTSTSQTSQSFTVLTSTRHAVKLKKHMLIYLLIVSPEK